MQDDEPKARKAKRKGRRNAGRSGWKAGFVSAVYVLTEGDVAAGSINIGKARFLYRAKAPGDGGDAAGSVLDVEFVPGGPTQADMSGKERLLGGSAMRAFLDAISAKAGDRLAIERTGAQSIRVSRAD